MAPSPPPLKCSLVSFPTPQILLVTLNRPQEMNCINTAGHQELDTLWNWYDAEPSLRCAIITGATDPAGKRKKAFCAGQDLKEWDQSSGNSTDARVPHPPGGFAGLSRRFGKKPIISAVDGICFGGGFETILNTDLVFATPPSRFSLPEALRGVAAIAGALPRLTMTLGLQRASELALTGRILTASEASNWGIVNKVVPDDVVGEAIKIAKVIAEEASPDSIIVSREGVRRAWDGEGVESAVERVRGGVWKGLEGGENIKEGLRAFGERRKPVWGDSKL